MLEGTIDDAKLVGSDIRDNATVPTLVSQIASITIKGQALGTTADDDSFGIVAEQINAAKIAATTLRFTKGAHSTADFFVISPTSDFGIWRGSELGASQTVLGLSPTLP